MVEESPKQTPGPEPERLSLPHEDWEDAVGDALKKPCPKETRPESADDEDEKPKQD